MQAAVFAAGRLLVQPFNMFAAILKHAAAFPHATMATSSTQLFSSRFVLFREVG